MHEIIPDLTPVVLAGGSGSRFWPLSRELSPKQLLTVFGSTSLIAQAIERVDRFAAPGSTIVLTSDALLREIRDHVAGSIDTSVRVLAEPSARNTAPAVALAAAYALTANPDAIIAMVPSDHLLDANDIWERTLRTAADAAREGWIVTLGLKPDAPDTGYGYIRPGSALESPVGVCVVDAFLEKPDHDTAERLVAEGCLWNSGMLVARADVILSELEAAGVKAATPDSSHGEGIAAVARELAATDPAGWPACAAHGRYDSLPAVQFDRAVLEVSTRVAVVELDVAWSDVGSLLSLGRLNEADERGNVFVGRVTDIDSRGTIAYSADRLLATLGLEDVLVVDTADATLVASKERAQDVRLLVNALKAVGAPEVVSSRSSQRPWGSWTQLLRSDGFLVKTIEVTPGKRLSLQSHAHRSEHWVVVEGRARVEIDGTIVEAGPGHSVDIPVGAVHRLSSVGDTSLRIIEIALGAYLSEDDIVRYEDDWARESRDC
jgi:mannose-1-phosphate guanylyltransferase/mannose-6-phosphate isomerase